MEVTEFLLLIAPLLLVTAPSLFARDLAEIRYRFTTCGMSGHRGPSLEQCREFYRENNSPIAQDNVLIGFEGYRGAQGFRVPRDGVYNVTIAGAAGGVGLCNPEFGLGLLTVLQVGLFTDYELLILVGQRGMSPCDIDNPPLVCENPPFNLDEAAECNATWYESLISDTTVNGSFYYPFVGGGGGGGASMVRRVIDGAVGQSAVISGGAGGSPAVLSYEVIRGITFDTSVVEGLAMNTGQNVTDQILYVHFLDAKSSPFDPLISTIDAARGFRNSPSDRPNVNAGAGGGLLQEPERPVTDIDGNLLGPPGSSFAEGGSDCASLLSFSGFQTRPLEVVYGGFGGGGGGCGGGGGGGGVSGGAVVQRGIDIPGGGGYSVFFGAANELNIQNGGVHTGLNFDSYGYVDIVPSDCGCVHDCDLDEIAEKFECLCPNDTQLAPDLSDCYNVTGLDLMQGLPTVTDPDGFYFTPLTFNATFVFSIRAPIRTTRKSGGQEGACAILFIGQDSEIILVSNVVSGSGTFDSLAQVVTTFGGEKEEEGVVKMSDLTEFLTSSVLVTGGLLVSTQPCSVEGMSIETNASIRDPDAESMEFQAILDVAANITSEFASRVLQLETSSTMAHTIVIAVVVPVVVVGVLALLLVIALLGYNSYVHKRKKTFSTAQSPLLDSKPEGPDATPKAVTYKVENIPDANADHSYELLHFDEENESDFPKNKTVVPKYGVSAPSHDFTDYNKLRSNTQIANWDYPRCNLIFIRNLGEGQFGKVLLMKAKGIAGYKGKIPVAVKTLSTTSTDPEVVRKFLEEAELMKKFTHPNIVSLLGISFKDEDEDDSSPLLILEYMPHGDLQSFLKVHRPQEDEMPVITESDLYGFVVDIARALEFLEVNRYVHRDVAARNCLVGSGLQIKIADFGLARGVYDKDYYRVAGRAVLPVRWMAPECLLYGIFTSASDVWSYGVVLYEIITYGELPLENMDVQEIIEEAQNSTLCHSRPESCPDIICDVMYLCHNHKQDQRPTFTEILVSLEKIRSDSNISIEYNDAVVTSS